ncbi:hypothetical protein [Methylomonas sp. DH-1]|uniref:hypothetical protein n=1 Tax=Methylomonas sp. (strain DH-1) TaxID=1727196 RepID=UPI001E2D206C
MTLLTDHIDSVRRVKRLYLFEIDAWVVLTDHMHMVLTLPWMPTISLFAYG